jgi:hypothetical protein
VVFPVSWTAVVLSLALYAAIGMALGALIGFSVSFLLRLNFRGILEDAFLGSFGFLLGFIGAAFMPWHRNTITYNLDNTVVTSTMNTYQHPGRVGFAVAIILPLLHELYRFGRSKSTH